MSPGGRWDGVARRSLWPVAIGPGRRPALWIGQVDLADFNDRLVAAEQAELPQDLGDVRFGRRLGELQFVGDLPVWVTLAQEIEHAKLLGCGVRSFACKAWVLWGFFLFGFKILNRTAEDALDRQRQLRFDVDFGR